MRSIIRLWLAALAGFFLIGCQSADEPPICGGVRDVSDHSAPKVIRSREIVALSSSFWVCDDNGEGGRWAFTIAEGKPGAFTANIRGELQGQIPVDAAFLARVQEVIERFKLAELNGTNRVTAGLAPPCSPAMLKVTYASGEQLYFRVDGNPKAAWAAALSAVFLEAFTQSKK